MTIKDSLPSAHDYQLLSLATSYLVGSKSLYRGNPELIRHA